MARNIEIKARAHNFKQQLIHAIEVADTEPEVIVQEDTFFTVAEGRLKLRVFADQPAELIYYKRSNITGPKLSEYFISRSDDPIGLGSILSNAYGVSAQVNKTRTLLLKGRARLHFDQVEDLGEFIELEVVLDDTDDLQEGEAEAQALMDLLDIRQQDLIDVAYADLIAKSQ